VNRRNRLEEQLKTINDAIAALDSNPEVAKVLELVAARGESEPEPNPDWEKAGYEIHWIGRPGPYRCINVNQTEFKWNGLTCR